MSTTTPLDPNALRQALSQTPGLDLEVAPFLSLPLECTPGVGCKLEQGKWKFRGWEVALSEDPLDDLFYLAALAQDSTDTFWEPKDGLVSAVRVRQSGANLISFGSQVILGVPTVVADPSVGESVVRHILAEKSLDPAKVLGFEVETTPLQWTVFGRCYTPKAATPNVLVAAEQAGQITGFPFNLKEVAGGVEVNLDLGQGYKGVVPVQVIGSGVRVGPTERTYGKGRMGPVSGVKVWDTPNGQIGFQESSRTKFYLTAV